MVRRLSWELERPSVAPSLRGWGSRPVYNRHDGKWRAAIRESEGVVVAMPAGTTQPAGAKDPYFIDADAGGRGSVSAR